MYLKNKMLLAFVCALSINGSVYSEESETPCSDKMLKRIFAIIKEHERVADYPSYKFIVSCVKNYDIYELLSSKSRWAISNKYPCKEGYLAFVLQESEPINEFSYSSPLDGELAERTDVGKMLSQKVNNEFITIIDKRMKCKKNKNGCLTCLLVVSKEEFKKEYNKFVEEQVAQKVGEKLIDCVIIINK